MGVPQVSTEIIQQAKSYISSQLCSKCLPKVIHGLDAERKQLCDLLKRTAELGESNSILVIGPHGSGKTMILKSVLEELRKKENVSANLMEVHLNGLMQTDDRIALKEITRQLKLENTVGDKVFGSFAENLQFLLDALKSGGKQSKSILFILEEFDLFAHHRNQTLLYNLFDISQSAQTPVCVMGLTARLDVTELLEKRVKSRFSHRQLYILPGWTFAQYLDIFRNILFLHEDFPDQKFAKSWNQKVQSLSEDAAVVDILKRQFSLSKNVSSLQSLLCLPVARVNETKPFIDSEMILDGAKIYTSDSKAAMLQGLSVLELALVIAMKHLMEIYHGEPFNFEMVFREYQKFYQRRSSLQAADKAVVLKAFEHLLGIELVGSAEGSSTKIQKEYRLLTLQVDAAQIMEALQKYSTCPTELKQWAASSIQ